MVQRRSFNAQSRSRLRRLGSVAALVAVAVVATPAAGAKAFQPPCERGQNTICLFENVNWNNGHGLDANGYPRSGRGRQSNYVGARNRGTYRLTRGTDFIAGTRLSRLSLINRVSSYANFSTSTYCVYDLKRDGRTRILLWRMKPGGTSRWVGRAKTRDGRSVNDRADLLAPC